MKQTTPRKKRSDSADAAIQAALAAAAPLPPWPEHVRKPEGVDPFWRAIIMSRSREEWAQNDYLIAAQLARAQLDIERTEELLEQEGPVVYNQRGTPVMNPRQSSLEQLARRQLALMRALQLSGSASGVRKEDVQKQRQLERKARAAVDDLTEDELLA